MARPTVTDPGGNERPFPFVAGDMEMRITPEARRSLAEELDGRILRISFTTGCGGSGYRLASADQPEDDDTIIEIDGVRVALDPMAGSHLDGATIAWDSDEDGFTLDHPDAVLAIWCG